MKKKPLGHAVSKSGVKSAGRSGNALKKEDEIFDAPLLPEDIQEVVDEELSKDEMARRIKMLDIKDKLASGRYSVSSADVAKAMIDHIGETPTKRSTPSSSKK